jgi:hypothetical protein
MTAVYKILDEQDLSLVAGGKKKSGGKSGGGKLTLEIGPITEIRQPKLTLEIGKIICLSSCGAGTPVMLPEIVFNLKAK